MSKTNEEKSKSASRLEELRKLTSDSEFLKSDDLGMVVSKGLATLYRENPGNPVDYLAKWLLNHASVQRAAEEQKKQQKEIHKHDKAYKKKMMKEQEKKDEVIKVEKSNEDKKKKFILEVQEQHDLGDTLQRLADHTKEFTGATACYIGKLVAPKLPVGDGDFDDAHVDAGADKIIHFQHATEGYEDLVDKTMTSDQGLLFDVFRDGETGDDDVKSDNEDNEEEEGEQKQKKAAPEKLPHRIVVKEVVREKRMHYFRVPRLGSFMAIRLEYNSCLTEEAFDAGVADMQSVIQRQADQDAEKEEFDREQQALREEREADEDRSEYVPEKREWPEIETESYIKKKVQYVLCMNTLGQDREFTEDEKLFALRTVQFYRDTWEKLEENNLRNDIKIKIQQTAEDKHYKEVQEAQDNQELEAKCEQAIQQDPDEEPMTEEQKNYALKKKRFELLTRTFFDPQGKAKHDRAVQKEQTRASQNFGSRRGSEANASDREGNQVEEKYWPVAPEQWRQKVSDLRQYNVVKYGRVLQTVAYMLGFSREEICERDTNKLLFKKMRSILRDNDFFEQMSNYKIQGTKPGEFREYERLQFLKKNLEKCHEEDVETYSMTMTKLLQWANLAIELRTEDVTNRRDRIEELRHERDVAIGQSDERQGKLDGQLNEAKEQFLQKWQDDMAKKKAEAGEDEEEDAEEPEEPPFPIDDFMAEFNTHNPPIEIPQEVHEDVDNDFDLPYSPPTFD